MAEIRIRDESPIEPLLRGRVDLREIARLGQVNLRGRADAGFLDAVAGAIDLRLPVTPNTWTAGGGIGAYWLGPDEWLILTAPGRETDLMERLRTALAGRHAAVTDVSSGHTVIELSGAHAADLIAKGCGLDLHPRVFGAGSCAQTLVAKAGVLLWQNDDASGYRLLVRRSFAPYLWKWLEDATEEFR